MTHLLTIISLSFFSIHIVNASDKYVSPDYTVKEFQKSSEITKRPFYHYGKVKYVSFGDDPTWITYPIFQKIAQTLPKNADILIYSADNPKLPMRPKAEVYDDYERWLPKERIHFLKTKSPVVEFFWAKSALPYPIWDDGKLALVDHPYVFGFEPDQEFGSFFNASIYKHEYLFKAGNFAANDLAECITVNNIDNEKNLPDRIFNEYYGCKKIIRLKHLMGIGDVNEVVKFIDAKTVVTNKVEYKNFLGQQGYKVNMLPDVSQNFKDSRGYVNTLFVNGTAYMPTLKRDEDLKAAQVYESFGFKVVPIDSRAIFNYKGAIDCLIMTYPEK